MPGDIVIDKEMGITHGEFFRNAARALEGRNHRTDANGIVLDDGQKRLEIVLSEEEVRRIALLSLPVTRVRLRFMGYSEAETAAFMETFDRAFQRGGG